MEGRLKVEMLGQFLLSRGGEELAGLQAPRMRALLSRLLLDAGRNVDRAELAFTLWPDSTEARARGSLRKLLHTLTSRLPDLPAYVAVGDRALRWRDDAPATVDLHEFERLAASGSLPDRLAAADLYAGPLLPGAYEPWVLAERERVRTRFAELLEGLAEDREERGEFLAAAAWIERLLDAEPFRESAWERLIGLYAAAGERGRALAAYERCKAALAAELDVEPGLGVKRARDRLLAASPAASDGGAAAAPPLIGREEELGHLRGLAHAALRAHRPYLLLVEGEAGLGKSALAGALKEWATSQGYAAYRTEAFAPDRGSPFAPLRQLLTRSEVLAAARQLPARSRAALAHLAPELAEGSPWAPATEEGVELARRLLFEALSELLFPPERQGLLVADDLQWLDGASLAWLRSLLLGGRAVGGPLVIGTVRPEESTDALNSLLAALEEHAAVARHELKPLGAEASARLLAELAPAPVDADTARRVHEETEGNPLFVVEWVGADKAGVLAEARTFEAYLDRLTGLPQRVHGLITGRLLALSAEARTVAEAGAVLGRTFGWRVLRAMLEGAEAELVDALDELCRRRVLREAGPPGSVEPDYDFSHGLIRDVVEARLSAARRRYLNDRAAAALTAVHGDDERYAAQVGEHLARAGRPVEAAGRLAGAARHARSLHANEQALAYQRRALGLLASLPDSVETPGAAAGEARSSVELRLELREGEGEVLHLLGRHAEAAEALAEAARDASLLPPDPLRAARLAMLSGNVARDANEHAAALRHYSAAEAHAARVLEPAAEGAVRRALVEVKAELISLHYRLGDEGAMARAVDELTPIARTTDDAYVRVRYHHTLALLAHRRNRFVSSGDETFHAREALAAAEKTRDSHVLATARFGWGFVQLWAFELEEAERHLAAGLGGAELTGDLLLEVRALTYLGVAARLRGEPDRVRELAARTLALAEGVGGSLEEYVAAAHAQGAWLAQQDGRSAAAISEGRRALSLWEGSAYPFRWLAAYPTLAAALEEGDPAVAAEAAEALLHPAQQPPAEASEQALRAGIAAWRQGDHTAMLTELGRARPPGPPDRSSSTPP